MMLKLTVILFLLFASEALQHYIIAQTIPDPVLYFSDITSGPKTGNTDVSLGQTSGENGAIVTIWGRNLSGGTVYCNSAASVYYYYRGNAVQPADLYSFLRMEMISFQIDHLAQDGSGTIYVIVNGRQSNTLPFNVRSGNIYFVKTNGNDAGNGAWNSPWKTIIKAKDAIGHGDIAYICNGVNQISETEFGACVNLGTDGLAGNPKALIVYPGAVSRVGNPNIGRAFHVFNQDSNRNSVNWVISKFTLTTAEVGVSGQSGFRVIGNFVTAPNGDGLDGAIGGIGSNVYILGNELDSVGSPNCDKLYHAIYITGIRRDDPPRAPTETNREVAWNYIHECRSNRAINVYSEQQYSAFIEGHRIHDNVIIDQQGDGILLGYYVTGVNSIYNNLIIRAGLGPEWVTGSSYHTGIRISAGHELVTGTIVYCYNNTLYGCGWNGAQTGESGHFLISPETLLHLSLMSCSNNIVRSTGEPYIAGESGAPPTGDYKNCWFGAGAAPVWDNTAINSDPLFVNLNANNFQLQSGSPCINSGRNLSAIVARDILGVSRPQGTAFDIGAFEYNPTIGINKISNSIPNSFKLYQNYPNPFNPSTKLKVDISKLSFVKLVIFDILGRLVETLVDQELKPGSYLAEWDASKYTSGIYFFKMIVSDALFASYGTYSDTKKMILVK